MRLAFPHAFEVQEEAEFSGAGKERVLYYPGAKTEGGRNGVVIKVIPTNAKPWIGCFAAGYRSNTALTEISTCPNPRHICVVSSGTAYVVCADDPDQWQTLPCFPVIQLMEIPDHELLVCCDFTKLLALGRHGIRWTTLRLASDGIKILSAENGFLRVLAWRAEHKKDVEIQVDIVTGEEIPSK